LASPPVLHPFPPRRSSDLPRDPARAPGPRLSRSLAGPDSVNSSPPGAGPGDDMGMSFDLVPAELLAASLTAVLISIPFAFVLAGAAIAGPRRSWNRAGLAMGIGLLVGVLLAAAGLFVPFPGAVAVLLNLGM